MGQELRLINLKVMDNKREELGAYKLSCLGWNHQKVHNITNYKAIGCRYENVIMFVQDSPIW